MVEETVVKKKKKRKTGINVKAKKKSAVARAVIKKGTGKIKVNNRNIEIINPDYVKTLIKEPVMLAGETAKEYDITVNVHGGGIMGQAVATRAVIAKALVQGSKDKSLKETFLAYDRMLLVDDVRRVEAKKPLGTKARKKKQKSKR
jgi:small subunit ribosomal protein S9